MTAQLLDIFDDEGRLNGGVQCDSCFQDSAKLWGNVLERPLLKEIGIQTCGVVGLLPPLKESDEQALGLLSCKAFQLLSGSLQARDNPENRLSSAATTVSGGNANVNMQAHSDTSADGCMAMPALPQGTASSKSEGKAAIPSLKEDSDDRLSSAHITTIVDNAVVYMQAHNDTLAMDAWLRQHCRKAQPLRIEGKAAILGPSDDSKDRLSSAAIGDNAIVNQAHDGTNADAWLRQRCRKAQPIRVPRVRLPSLVARMIRKNGIAQLTSLSLGTMPMSTCSKRYQVRWMCGVASIAAQHSLFYSRG